MTVAELKRILDQYPDGAKVEIPDRDYNMLLKYVEVKLVEAETIGDETTVYLEG